MWAHQVFDVSYRSCNPYVVMEIYWVGSGSKVTVKERVSKRRTSISPASFVSFCSRQPSVLIKIALTKSICWLQTKSRTDNWNNQEKPEHYISSRNLVNNCSSLLRSKHMGKDAVWESVLKNHKNNKKPQCSSPECSVSCSSTELKYAEHSVDLEPVKELWTVCTHTQGLQCKETLCMHQHTIQNYPTFTPAFRSAAVLSVHTIRQQTLIHLSTHFW